jgi:hypothetical protein
MVVGKRPVVLCFPRVPKNEKEKIVTKKLKKQTK